MALVSQSIPNLINGVSQQPPSLRLNSQAEVQENGLSSAVEGLSKRPCTEYIADLGAVTNLDKAFIHTIRRDETEFYSLVIDTAGLIKVFDKDGVSKTVTNNASSYLTGLTNPKKELAAVSIADNTFIVNKNTTVAKDTTTSATRNPEALVYVKNADYSSTYRLKVTKGGTTKTVEFATKSSTQDNTTNTQNAERGASTDLIAENLNTFSGTSVSTTYYENITNATAISGLTFTRYDNVIHIQSTNSTDFQVEVGDSHGNEHLLVFKDETADFKKLPVQAPNDYIIKISGDNNKAQDDYYVKFTDGVWKETLASDVLTSLNNSTLPHRLEKQSDGTFVFEEIDYKDRLVGDDETNPFPSFVDFTINDIFFFKNRLGLLADENVVFSRAGEFINFDFFRKTTLTIVDSDIIDVAVSSNKVSILKHAVPFNESLLLFSDLTQFKLTGDPVLTPDTVNISNTTEFEASLRAKPAQAGKFVYFASKRGDYSGMWEYFVDTDTDTNDASETTAHVPEYIDGEVTNIQASSNEDMILVQADDDKESIYVYRFFYSGREKLQASWSKWTFGDDVVNCSFNLADIMLLVKRGSNLHLEKINLSVDSAEAITDGAFPILLDRRVTLESGGTETVPYSDSNLVYVDQTGEVITLSEVAGKLTASEKVFAGLPYTFKYQFSEPVVKIENKPATTAKLKIRSYAVVYNQTGYFTTEVTPNRRTTYTRTFTGRIIGGAYNILNQAAIDSGTYKFGVLSDSEDTSIVIKSDSHLPCNFQSAEWEGFYTLRSRRV